jgi:hypothetical protein
MRPTYVVEEVSVPYVAEEVSTPYLVERSTLPTGWNSSCSLPVGRG